MKNMKSCRGNWLTNKSDFDKRVGVPIDTWETNFFLCCPLLTNFFLYVTVQSGTQLFLFSLSVYLECHKSSQILSLLSVNKLLSFSVIRLSTTENKDWVLKCSKSTSLSHKAVSTPIQRSEHLHFQGTNALRLSALEVTFISILNDL